MHQNAPFIPLNIKNRLPKEGGTPLLQPPPLASCGCSCRRRPFPLFWQNFLLFSNLSTSLQRVPIERVPIGRVPIERVIIERVPIERVTIERVTIERVTIERVPIGRVPIERVIIERVPIERVTIERVSGSRSSKYQNKGQGALLSAVLGQVIQGRKMYSHCCILVTF